MPTAPLDNLETAVNVARVRLLDAIQALAGDIVLDTGAFTLTAINAAWRRLQELLVNFGCPWLTLEVNLASVPLVTSADAGVFVYFNWANYWDGTGLQAAPVLPQDLIAPVRLWERAHGTTSFFPMDKLVSGLPAVPKLTYNKSWEWRNGAIWMPGSTQVMDLRLRYAAFYADFLASASVGVVNTVSTGNAANWVSGTNFTGKVAGDTIFINGVSYVIQTVSSTTALILVTNPGNQTGVAWGNPVAFTSQTIPIVRSLNAFAWFICAEVAKPRGDLDAGDFEQKGQLAARYIIELDPMEQRSVNAEFQPPPASEKKG
jgi:hypothetical protein